MAKQIIATTNAPSAIGPYSQGVIISGGEMVFTSGQLPINPVNGELVKDDIKKATEQSLENVKAVLEAAGSSIDQVVKATVFLKDLNDFQAMNEIYAQYFKQDCPARSAFQVAKLPLDALVEIEVIAVK